ncbi:hypothetical protein KAR91_71905 [Candidatus Pacearchaeota archaeon]|nr:hypothetical protein [Candidatus Pacearchaeota archaeon]
MSTHNPIPNKYGRIIAQVTANPAAGAGAAIVAPAQYTSQPLSLAFQLACDANAADRSVYLQYDNSVVAYPIGAGGFVQTANETMTYIFGLGMGQIIGSDGPFTVGSLADTPAFLTGHFLNIVVVNIQATDALTGIGSIWNSWPWDQT